MTGLTLGDLARFDDNEFRIYCSGGKGCQREKVLKVKDLIARYDKDKPLYSLKFKCECGSTKWLPIIQPEVFSRRSPLD